MWKRSRARRTRLWRKEREEQIESGGKVHLLSLVFTQNKGMDVGMTVDMLLFVDKHSLNELK